MISSRTLITTACLLAMAALPAAAPMTLQFRGADYVHRWSKAGQNEFTPAAEPDLTKWRDMVTVNVHESVKSGEQLAGIANQIVGNYQRRGKIVKTDSKPRTAAKEAEHLIVGVLGDPAFLEAAFVRCVMVNGVGYAAVYSHRVYGAKAGPAMGEWLAANGAAVEAALMNWQKLPAAADLRALPQAK